ncbi:MmgE/PrpD family protein [Ferrovibrio sp.]|uniref:MmgE/PrpD family protein n=1 Tax=Ferrovibrio sp. TaxID=1917215 RepID=UPI000CAC6C7B|nr:MmgE/PrpD family protein [Ferrovibrio sp.]PJI38768.1 MAG: hypothetical protein CTR53_16075 [Ferrovibrio sp.]
MAGVSATYAEFICATQWRDVAPQMHEAKRSILNYFATALASAQDPAVAVPLRVFAPFAGTATSGVIGRLDRTDAPTAAFLNAVSANLLDYDDTHVGTIIHPTAPVAAPLFALAEARGLTGRDLLTAFLLGVEIECRIGNAVSPMHYARGWHITSTCGVFGAAAATAKLLGLDRAATCHALAIAASQSAGIIENLPTAGKNVSVGNAARNGMLSALLAGGGYRAAEVAIEGPLGWARAMGDVPDIVALTDGLGDSWQIAKNTYKPYPAGIVFHAVIDACLRLRARIDNQTDGIAAVEVRGSALLLARGDRPVRNERDARVSIHHAAACALLTGRAGIAEFMTPVVFDPAVAGFRDRVRAARDDSMSDGAATVQLRMASGDLLQETVLDPRGSLADPLSDADLEDKLRQCAVLGGSGWDTQRVIDAVWHLDELKDIGGLMQQA